MGAKAILVNMAKENARVREANDTQTEKAKRDALRLWNEGQAAYGEALNAADQLADALRRADHARVDFDKAMALLARHEIASPRPVWPFELALLRWEGQHPLAVANRVSGISVGASWPHSQWRELLVAVRDFEPANIEKDHPAC